MAEQLFSFLGALIDQTGLARFWWGNVVMIAIGCVMIYLAISKRYEPLLLVGIGFSCIISNVPGSDLIQPGGLFHYAYQGVALLVVPPLIFFGVGFAPRRSSSRAATPLAAGDEVSAVSGQAANFELARSNFGGFAPEIVLVCRRPEGHA